MRARLALLAWLLGLLFPLAWLGRFSNTYRRVFDAVFGPEWVHVVMHAALYAGLAILLASTLKLPNDRRAVLLICGLTLCVGLAQEGLQAFSQGLRPDMVVLGRSAFDLGVDVLGALLGLSALSALRARQTAH